MKRIWSEMGQCFSHEETEVDEKFKKLLNVAQEAKYLHEVDFSTKFWIELCKLQIPPPTAPKPSSSDVKNVAPQMLLPVDPAPIDNTQVTVRFTKLDEDTGNQKDSLTGLVEGMAFAVAQKFPIEESSQSYFKTIAEGIKIGNEILGMALPTSEISWDELSSDNAISLLCFYGLGQMYLTVARNKVALALPGAAYEVDLSFMNNYETRAPFEKYGAVGVFDAKQVLLGIYWCTKNKMVRPKDADWEHVKFVLKSTLITAVTVKDHLAHLHWINSNNLVFSSRQNFPSDHPLRRLLKQHTYRGATINWASKGTLLPIDALAYRVFAIDKSSWNDVLADSISVCQYETFADYTAKKGLTPAMEEEMPYLRDGKAFWAVVHKYVAAYIDAYFPTEQMVMDDVHIKGYWAHYGPQPLWPSYGLPELSKANLINQVTHVIFAVTGGHEFAGSVVEYLLSPGGLGNKIMPGKAESDVQSYLQALSLIALTGEILFMLWWAVYFDV